MRTDDAVAARFWSKVQPTGFCWEWTAYTNFGYGYFRVSGKNYRAHRFAYELLVGSIPEGAVLDHLCRNRKCVNPDHLEPVNNRENLMRGYGATAEHARADSCPAGHPYSGNNLYVTPEGFRHCRECRRARTARWGTQRRPCPVCGRMIANSGRSGHLKFVHQVKTQQVQEGRA